MYHQLFCLALMNLEMYRDVSFGFSRWVPTSDWHRENILKLRFFLFVCLFYNRVWCKLLSLIDVFMVVLCFWSGNAWFLLVASSPSLSRHLGKERGFCGCSFLIKAEVLLILVVFVPFCLSVPLGDFYLTSARVPGTLWVTDSQDSTQWTGEVWILGFPCMSVWILSPQLVALFCKIV